MRRWLRYNRLDRVDLFPGMKHLLSLVISLSIAISTFAQSAPPVKLISSPKFVMPPEAVAARIDGQMLVSFTVDENGNVTRAEVVAGPRWPCDTSPERELDLVRDAVRDNLLGSKFTPYIKDNKPQSIDLTVTFRLEKELERYRKQKAQEEAAIRQQQAAIENSKPMPEPKIVRGGVVNGRAISLPKPSYPAAARSERVSGVVTVEVLIDESGKVIEAGAISGHPVLQKASRKAACAARFSPTLIENQPVKVSGVITYNFAI